MQTLQTKIPIPESCPVDMPHEALGNIGTDSLVDVAVRFTEFSRSAESLQTTEDAVMAVGYTACRTCAHVSDCTGLSLQASELLDDPSIKHPLAVRDEIDGKSLIDIWGRYIAIEAESNGYTRQSVANMLGAIDTLNPGLKGMLVAILEHDSSHIPTAIGMVKLDSGAYTDIEFEDVRLLIRNRTMSDLSDNPFLVETITQLMSRERDGKTLTRESLENGQLPRALVTQIKSVPSVKEFRPDGSKSAVRGFGIIIGKNEPKGISKDLLLIHTVGDVKGGVNGTMVAARNTERALRTLEPETIDETVANSKQILRLKKQ